jgi:flagellum-specific peptidoglycan hydrolase FlgJ
MKKPTLVLMLILATGISFAGQPYVKKFRPVADSLSAHYGIPAEVMLAVAIVESGAGTSRNSKLLNNHFGIVGKNNLLASKGIKSAYKQYAAAEHSYADFCRVVSRKKFYASMKGQKNSEAWVMAISNAGYSTMPAEWRMRVLNVLRTYNFS